MSRMLSASDAIRHKEELVELFSYCKLISTGELPEREFCERKIDELITYLSDGKAYLFAQAIDGRLVGFLWACRIMREQGERFHTLYVAVSEQAQGGGIGSLLLSLAEDTARALSIDTSELNVHYHNEKARNFYEKRGYAAEGKPSAERITFVKKLF